MKTLVISKQDVPDLLMMPELIEKVRQAYVVRSDSNTIFPQRLTSQIQDTSVVVNIPGYLPGEEMFTVKVNTKSPRNSSIGLPFLIGTILLIDQNTGQLLAIMDSGLITAMRTGAAGAVGVECLARPTARHISLVGAGVQGEWQIRALHALGRVESVYIYDAVKSQAEMLSERLSKELNISFHIASSLREVVSATDILILATQSKSSLITSDMLHPGLHINAFGADQPGKVELDAETINQSLVVVDDKKLALTDGSLNVPYQQGLLAMDNFLDIGEVLVDKSLGRKSLEQVTIFGNVGLAFQDLVACNIIYRRALHLKMGSWIELDNSITTSIKTPD